MLNVLKKLFKKNSSAIIYNFQGRKFSFEEIKLDLAQYTGGNVELNIDEKTSIATICLSHLGKKNSITGKMIGDLDDVIKQLETWTSGKGLIIFGAENNFCAGGDLNNAKILATSEGGYKMATFMQNILIRLQQLPLISVAFIEGLAMGGGAEVAISCDFRLFSDNCAAIGFVHNRLGLIPAWGGLSAVVRTLGYRTALNLVTLGRMVEAEEAQTIGLCDGVVGNMTEAMDWLAKRTRASANTIRAAKSVAIYSSLESSQRLEDILEFEKNAFCQLWGSPAHKLALDRYLKHK